MENIEKTLINSEWPMRPMFAREKKPLRGTGKGPDSGQETSIIDIRYKRWIIVLERRIFA